MLPPVVVAGGTGSTAGGAASAGGGEVGAAGGGDVGTAGGGDVGTAGGGNTATAGGGTTATAGGGNTATAGGGMTATAGGGMSGTAGGGSVGPGVELNEGWVGGACTSAQSCNEPGYTSTVSCETNGFINGFCTQSCTLSGSTYICPDAAQTGGTSGNTLTRCISANGLPKCVAECDFIQSPQTGCRTGYTCVNRQRYNQPNKIFKVCLPSAGQRWPGEPAPANDIGGACLANENCANNSCISMPSGYCSKSMCDTAGCPAGSSCFGIGNGQTACLKNCTADTQCRQSDGYICNTTHGVCLQGASTGGTWNPSVGASDCMVAWGTNGSGLSPCDAVKDDYVVARKSARNMAFCRNGMLVQNFKMSLGFAPVGDKQVEGDGKTPEGVFYVGQLNPNSSYYKSFLVSYPDSADAVRGLSAGLITQAQKNAIDTAQANCTIPPQTTELGSYIMIHGSGSTGDWTLGCMALDNPNVDTLWSNLAVRDTIVVLP
ncbi:MAG: L,D-transpeptidase family protein [Myxococcaceae bacterium]|nr:L,D-transpeptidase family protein [Myxococcaceae bacterium]